jgi:ABC-type transport system substrate-binding protein
LISAGVVAVAAALLASSGGAHGVREGGTFRMAVPVGWFEAVDPALPISGSEIDVLRPACAALMQYPHRPLPAGLRLAPELAQAYPVVSKDGKTYTFTIRRNARFSTGSPVLARDFEHALERIFAPAMQSGFAGYFDEIVGARRMLAGKTTTLAGVTAKGRRLTLRLNRPIPDLPSRTTTLCAVPAGLPIDAEGAKPPIPSAAPYYVARYTPGERLVLERNRFYRGARPHHVERFVVNLKADASAVDQVRSGKIDYVWPAPDLNQRLEDVGRRYAVNKTRFFAVPALVTRMFFLNTSRPLFRNNVELRQAVNFAADRRALTREIGPHVATPTDQYLPPSMPGFRNERLYPLAEPDLRTARSLARGRTRSGKAVLYTCSRPDCVAPAQILQRDLKAIGLDVQIKRFPTALFFQKASRPKEPFDILWLGWQAGYNDPSEFIDSLFHGRSLNFSRFDSPKYNRLIERASRLAGRSRYRAYGDVDVRLARDAAPAISYAVLNAWAFVSARVGCVIMNPFLDLTAACLE